MSYFSIATNTLDASKPPDLPRKVMISKTGFCLSKVFEFPMNAHRKTSKNVHMTSLCVPNIIIHHPEGSEGAYTVVDSLHMALPRQFRH